MASESTRPEFDDIADGASVTLGDQLNSRLGALRDGVTTAWQSAGDYDSGATYFKNDVVAHSDSRWLALADGLVASEPDGSNPDWEKIGSGATELDADTLDALAGTDGTPSDSNRFVTDSDPRMDDSRDPNAHASSHATGGDDEIVPSDIGALDAGQDLADLNDAATARGNLGLGTLALQNADSITIAGDVDGGGYELTNIKDGLSPSSAATVGQLQTISSGFNPVGSVRVATAAALPAHTMTGNTMTASANGSLNGTGIDGVTSLLVGDKFLNKDDTTGGWNGEFEIDALGSAGAPWSATRTSRFDEDTEIVKGSRFNVREGSTNANTAWYLEDPGTVTVNTTPLVFAKDLSGAGEINGVTNVGDGDGLIFQAKSGVNFLLRRIKALSSRVSVATSGDNVTIDVDESALDLGNQTGTVGPTKGGTGLTAAALGEIIYGSASNVWSRLTGNTTTTRKFLRQVGDGSNSAAPVWDTLAANDLPLGTNGARGAIPPVNSVGNEYFLGNVSGVPTWKIPVQYSRFDATSSTSLSLGTGSKTFTTNEAGRSYAEGIRLRLSDHANPATVYMEGEVTARTDNTFTIDVDLVEGSGTVSFWNVNAVGEPGAQGPAGEGVPAGGTTGQVLAKVDGTDYNTAWTTISASFDTRDAWLFA